MTRPPLDAFLAVSSETEAGVDAVERQLQAVLSDVIVTHGVDQVADGTGLDRAVLSELQRVSAGERKDPVSGLTLSAAAGILAVGGPFPRPEVRGRIRDELHLAMSRGPTDVAALCEGYGFGDPDTLRAAIEGAASLDLRTYARLRVALGSNHNP